MGTYVKLSQVEGLRESDSNVYECDKKIKRFFRASNVVGSGKEGSSVSHVGFSPAGSIVSICAGTKVIFYNYIEEQIVYTYHDSRDFVRCCSFRSDGKVAAVSDDGGWIQLIALELKSNLKKWQAHQAACHTHQFSSNKTRLMTGGDDSIAKYWDTVSGEIVQEFKFHSDKIRALSDFCGSEKMWVTGGYDTVAYLFDVRDASKPMAKIEHGTPIEFVDVSSGNNLLMTVGGNILKLWDISNGLKMVHSFEPHQRAITSGHIRDALLTSSLDGTVRYFNYSSIHRADYVSFDDKYIPDQNGIYKYGEEDEDYGIFTPQTESPKVNSDSARDFRTPMGPECVNIKKGGNIIAPDLLPALGNEFDNAVPPNDHAEFITPEEEAPVTLQNGITSVATAKNEGKTMHYKTQSPFESAVSNIASPRRINRDKDSDDTQEESNEERSVTLRHVYRFDDAVTAFAVSVDSKTIAVGLASGEWIIRHNPKTILEHEPKPKKVFKVVENVVEYKTVKLTLLDRLVKTFQYQAAMDLALSLSADHVYNLVETLILRGSLATAVRGKDEQTIIPLLRFLSSHLGSGIRNTNSLLELAHAVLDNNEWLQSCDNNTVIQELRKIPHKINFELFQHNILQTLKGSLDLILSQQAKMDNLS
ncbi:WD40 repeat containing protein [Babesia gibsoni]|uniref:WD40 repeat containing protein n=1 Tax=Babesia gibsoni TaxID=33632 RepID=A0AAD8LIS2_BABGI|nr:WD40 repeat containing protein [Babesia gibsoni]